VKDGITTVDAMVVDCTTPFEQEMEVITALQEDTTL